MKGPTRPVQNLETIMTKQEQQSDQSFIAALICGQDRIAHRRGVHPACQTHQHNRAVEQQLIVWAAT